MALLQDHDLLDGVDHVETRADFYDRLRRDRPLTVKLGLDPTSADLHLGHAVVLRKLQQFVKAGHRVILIIGDFTAQIGDPSGRNAMRPPLSREQIESNMRTYKEQAGSVLDLERVELRYNSEWLARQSLTDLLIWLSQVTVAQMLEREDFKKRYANGVPISLHEFLYPVAQAIDSVAIEADVELGGNDQLFNLLMARQFQQRFGQLQEVAITLPLLVGIDGEKKMSKTTGNFVGLTEPAREKFGKLMRIPDSAIMEYARIAAFYSHSMLDDLGRSLRTGLNPMVIKKDVAEDIVALYHGREDAIHAREYFESTVQRREVPIENIPVVSLGDARRVTDVMLRAGLAESKRAAERLIAGKGVRVDGILVTDPKALWTWTGVVVLSVGSHKFVKVTPNER